MYSLPTIDLVILSSCAVAFGLYLLIKGGNWTIDSASQIARRCGLSPMVIGFTVVAFGTSLPELIVSLNASFQDVPGIALGNVVGSNIANILLIIGAAAAISAVTVKWQEMRNDFAMMIISSCLLLFFLQEGVIERAYGGIMFAVLIVYVFWQIRHSAGNQESMQPGPVQVEKYETTAMAALFLLIGLGGVALGADMLVRGAVQIAEIAGVSEAVIGMTIVAIGTSLPELTVAIAAARKNEGDMVLGNVIGSNVFNVLSILGLTALVKPLPIQADVISKDIYFLIAVSVIFTVWALFQPRLGRVVGVIMLVLYGLFLVWQY